MKQAPAAIDTYAATKAELIKKLAECAAYIKACAKEISRLEECVAESDAQIKSAQESAAAINLEMTRQDHVHGDELELISAKLDKLLTLQKV